MKSDNKIVLAIFFPITIYFFIGTLVFFLTTKIDELSEWLGRYSGFPGLENYSAHNWHERSIWLTVFFPITWPVVFTMIACLLLYSFISALFRFFSDMIKIIWRAVVCWVTAFWKWITESMQAIWEWTVDSIESVWKTISGIFH